MAKVRGQAWETAFITLWINDNKLPTDRARAIVECAKRADDIVEALEEARGLPPILKPEPEEVVPPEAIDAIALPLLPSLRSYYRLWRAVAVEPGNVDYYQDQLVRTLGAIPNPYSGPDAAMKRLIYMDITHANLEDLEVMIFGRRVPKDGILPSPPADGSQETLP